MINWHLDQQIKELADKFYFAYEMPNLEAFSNVALRYSQNQLSMHAAEFQIYQDSLSEIVNLIDEARFLSAISWAYLQDMSEDFKVFADSQPPISITGLVGALLAPHVNHDNPPSILFDNPSSKISRNRLIGTWFAGNLLDSAIIRQLAVIDRVLAILYVSVGIQISTFQETGEPIYPTLSANALAKLKQNISEEDSASLAEIFGSQEFANLKDFRNRFLHRHRIETQLHGDFFYKIAKHEPKLFRGLPSEEHVAYSFYAHKLVTIPFVNIARKYLP